PQRAAAEMIRVCRPGGTIAMANWVPHGFIAKVFAAGARYVPPPEGIPSPVLWGDEATARERLESGASQIRMTRRLFEMTLPFGPAQAVQFFRTYFGPTVMAFSRLDPQQQAAYAADLENLWREHNQASGEEVFVPAEYLEVIAIRR